MPTTSVRISYLAIFWVLLATLSGCSKPDYQTADGNSGRFADTRGKWLLINYWADWCKPCIEEMPELHRFQQQQSDRVVLLTVNYDGLQGQSLQQQIEKLQIKLPVLLQDPAPLLGFQRPDALPTTLVFDPQGALHAALQGAQTMQSLVEATTKEATTK
ncbi:MAG: TlpA disulfide reductase family protein [Spongiibacteraceae bacterium]